MAGRLLAVWISRVVTKLLVITLLNHCAAAPSCWAVVVPSPGPLGWYWSTQSLFHVKHDLPLVHGIRPGRKKA